MNVTKENVMKINILTKRLMGFVFALSLLLSVGITASSTAQAQDRWQQDQIRREREYQREQQRRQRDWRYNNQRPNDNLPYFGGSFQLRQTALNAGYNEGIKQGRNDRSHGQRFEFRDDKHFRNADTDYSSRLGSRELYQEYYRVGYQNGYTDGYRGN